MNFENFKYNKALLPQNNLQHDAYFVELKKQWADELKTNPTYQTFFNKFDPTHIEAFISNYVQRKASIVSNYIFLTEIIAKPNELFFREEAETIFKAIKQKKLFNMQLLWRAGKLSIPGVKNTSHFFYWSKHIDECPFLEEIQPEEVEAMIQFMQNHQNFDNEIADVWEWQDYDELTEKDEDDDYIYMPEWYEFYDNHFRTGPLLLLPNTVGQLEEHYYQAAIAARQAEETSSPIQQTTPANHTPFKPALNALDHYYEFASEFEQDPHIRYLNTLDKKMQDSEAEISDLRENLHQAIDILLDATEIVYMPGGKQWHEAILDCAFQYKNKQLAASMNSIYAEYLLFKHANITTHNKTSQYKKVDQEIVTLRHNMLMKGRRALGEPENYNYLPQGEE